ncbi:hypothetical protein GCM10018965_081940 [Nonomuraea roseola]
MANERLRAALLSKGIDIEQLTEAIQVAPKTAERWVTQGRQPYRSCGRLPRDGRGLPVAAGVDA